MGQPRVISVLLPRGKHTQQGDLTLWESLNPLFQGQWRFLETFFLKKKRKTNRKKTTKILEN